MRFHFVCVFQCRYLSMSAQVLAGQCGGAPLSVFFQMHCCSGRLLFVICIANLIPLAYPQNVLRTWSTAITRYVSSHVACGTDFHMRSSAVWHPGRFGVGFGHLTPWLSRTSPVCFFFLLLPRCGISKAIHLACFSFRSTTRPSWSIQGFPPVF